MSYCGSCGRAVGDWGACVYCRKVTRSLPAPAQPEWNGTHEDTIHSDLPGTRPALSYRTQPEHDAEVEAIVHECVEYLDCSGNVIGPYPDDVAAIRRAVQAGRELGEQEGYSLAQTDVSSLARARAIEELTAEANRTALAREAMRLAQATAGRMLARVAHLEQALRNFGQHVEVVQAVGGGRSEASLYCPADPRRIVDRGPCICGLDAALNCGLVEAARGNK